MSSIKEEVKVSYFNKFYKHATSAVEAVAKYMDEKFDPFCDLMIEAVNDLKDEPYIVLDEERAQFRERIQEAFGVFFEKNTLRFFKPKLEGNKKGMTGYTMFVKECRQEIMEKYELENDKETFGKLSRIMGREWSTLSVEEKQEYKDRAVQMNGENKIKKKEEDKPSKKEEEKMIKEEEEKSSKKEDEKTNKKPIKKDDDKPSKKEDEKPSKKEEDKPSKKEEDKPAKKEAKKEEDKLQNKYESSFSYEHEDEIDVEDYDFWKRSSHIKGTKNIYFHKENSICFSKEDNGDYNFIGVVFKGKLYDHTKHADFPKEIVDYARRCGFKNLVKSKKATQPVSLANEPKKSRVIFESDSEEEN